MSTPRIEHVKKELCDEGVGDIFHIMQCTFFKPVYFLAQRAFGVHLHINNAVVYQNGQI